MQQQPPAFEFKNLIIALVLASVVMIGWQYFYEKPLIEKKQAIEAARTQELADAAPYYASPPKTGGLQLPSSNDAGIATAQAAIDNSPRITIESDTLRGSLSLKGAQFDDITLSQYREELAENADVVHLLSPGNDEHPSYSADFGVISANPALALPGRNSLWRADNMLLTPNQPVTLRYDNGAGLLFEKTIALDAHYMFTVSLKITNRSRQPVALYPYGLINRVAPSESKSMALLHEGPISVINDTLEHIKYSELRDDGNVEYTGTGWLGITDKYWLTALIPAAGESVDMAFRHVSRNGKSAYQVDLRGSGVEIPAGASHAFTTRFYAGAKEVKLLDQYSDLLNIPLFDRAVDFGFLYFLTKPLFLILSFFSTLVGNFGMAILLLTICIRLLMFPLANKSFTAMSKMKLLAPKMKELREKHADDSMKMNMEIMQMYKREKVNPVSGCLPILLQLPVFFALYRVLFVTIEMRHAPFFGWIQDLSAPDPTSIINLFGMLPFSTQGLPGWINIGIWPLIMCATMVFQQKLNPKPADAVQAAVIGWMPYAFLFMFANFPAGLVVYWAWNNTLSISQQWLIQRRIKQKAEAKKQAS
jgi:YidC/Oxa1 family membrane protein insertase